MKYEGKSCTSETSFLEILLAGQKPGHQLHHRGEHNVPGLFPLALGFGSSWGEDAGLGTCLE